MHLQGSRRRLSFERRCDGRSESTTYLFDHPLNAIASGEGTVLVEVAQGQPFDGRISRLDGRVAKLFVGLFDLSPLDPAVLESDLGHEIEFATCAELLRHPDATGAGELQPEIAATMPDVSSDRLTYTFTIRPGFRFSPPSGEAVTAETIRHSIERALSPRLGIDAPAARLVGDIAGARAFWVARPITSRDSRSPATRWRSR